LGKDKFGNRGDENNIPPQTDASGKNRVGVRGTKGRGGEAGKELNGGPVQPVWNR